MKAFDNLESLIDSSDAIYIATPHLAHYPLIKQCVAARKHVLCETPMVLKKEQAEELFALAEENGVVLMEANKTAHCPAFNHLMVMIKSGMIGQVVDVEASLSKLWDDDLSLREFDASQAGGSMYELGSYPLLPIVKLMGLRYENLNLYSRITNGVDMYTKGVFHYPYATCSFKVGLGVKTEGNLVISGTKGYAYVRRHGGRQIILNSATKTRTKTKNFSTSGTAAVCAMKFRNSFHALSTKDSQPHASADVNLYSWPK